jgi:hypothetical protein
MRTGVDIIFNWQCSVLHFLHAAVLIESAGKNGIASFIVMFMFSQYIRHTYDILE